MTTAVVPAVIRRARILHTALAGASPVTAIRRKSEGSGAARRTDQGTHAAVEHMVLRCVAK